MRLIRLAALAAALLAVAACTSDGRKARSTPPTPYVAMNEKHPFGVTHQDRDDGWTEILVRLNESSSQERARDMAWYYAARLGAHRKARSVYVAGEQSDVYCHVTQHRGPGVVVIGDPITMLASLAFSAVSASTTIAETFEAYPLHLLLVSLSNSEADAEGMSRVPVAETLASLQPRFEPKAAAAPDPADDGKGKRRGKKRRKNTYSETERSRWATNAQANVSVCVDRYERQKQAQQAKRKQKRKRSKRAEQPEAKPEPDRAEQKQPETAEADSSSDSRPDPEAETAAGDADAASPGEPVGR